MNKYGMQSMNKSRIQPNRFIFNQDVLNMQDDILEINDDYLTKLKKDINKFITAQFNINNTKYITKLEQEFNLTNKKVLSNIHEKESNVRNLQQRIQNLQEQLLNEYKKLYQPIKIFYDEYKSFIGEDPNVNNLINKMEHLLLLGNKNQDNINDTNILEWHQLLNYFYLKLLNQKKSMMEKIPTFSKFQIDKNFNYQIFKYQKDIINNKHEIDQLEKQIYELEEKNEEIEKSIQRERTDYEKDLNENAVNNDLQINQDRPDEQKINLYKKTFNEDIENFVSNDLNTLLSLGPQKNKEIQIKEKINNFLQSIFFNIHSSGEHDFNDFNNFIIHVNFNVDEIQQIFEKKIKKDIKEIANITNNDKDTIRNEYNEKISLIIKSINNIKLDASQTIEYKNINIEKQKEVERQAQSAKKNKIESTINKLFVNQNIQQNEFIQNKDQLITLRKNNDSLRKEIEKLIKLENNENDERVEYLLEDIATLYQKFNKNSQSDKSNKVKNEILKHYNQDQAEQKEYLFTNYMLYNEFQKNEKELKDLINNINDISKDLDNNFRIYDNNNKIIKQINKITKESKNNDNFEKINIRYNELKLINQKISINRVNPDNNFTIFSEILKQQQIDNFNLNIFTELYTDILNFNDSSNDLEKIIFFFKMNLFLGYIRNINNSINNSDEKIQFLQFYHNVIMPLLKSKKEYIKVKYDDIDFSKVYKIKFNGKDIEFSTFIEEINNFKNSNNREDLPDWMNYNISDFIHTLLKNKFIGNVDGSSPIAEIFNHNFLKRLYPSKQVQAFLNTPSTINHPSHKLDLQSSPKPNYDVHSPRYHHYSPRSNYQAHSDNDEDENRIQWGQNDDDVDEQQNHEDFDGSDDLDKGKATIIYTGKVVRNEYKPPSTPKASPVAVPKSYEPVPSPKPVVKAVILDGKNINNTGIKPLHSSNLDYNKGKSMITPQASKSKVFTFEVNDSKVKKQIKNEVKVLSQSSAKPLSHKISPKISESPKSSEKSSSHKIPVKTASPKSSVKLLSPKSSEKSPKNSSSSSSSHSMKSPQQEKEVVKKLVVLKSPVILAKTQSFQMVVVDEKEEVLEEEVVEEEGPSDEKEEEVVEEEGPSYKKEEEVEMVKTTARTQSSSTHESFSIESLSSSENRSSENDTISFELENESSEQLLSIDNNSDLKYPIIIKIFDSFTYKIFQYKFLWNPKYIKHLLSIENAIYHYIIKRFIVRKF
jgi:hypothetical protein